MKNWNFKKVALKEKFWKSIHLFYFSAEAKIICYSILPFIPDNSLVSSLFLFLHHELGLVIIYKILLSENTDIPNVKTQAEIVVPDDEQQAMRYVAGYIIYSLIGKYKKILGPILTIVF